MSPTVGAPCLSDIVSQLQRLGRTAAAGPLDQRQRLELVHLLAHLQHRLTEALTTSVEVAKATDTYVYWARLSDRTGDEPDGVRDELARTIGALSRVMTTRLPDTCGRPPLALAG